MNPWSNSEEDEAYGTPPSSPVKENRPLPRSLARPTAKKAVRQVQNLCVRVDELKGCELSSACSFLVSDWNYEFGDQAVRLSKEVDPEKNTAILLNRVKLVYNLFKEAFANVSGVYVGKSVNQRVRFNHHQRKKKKEGCMLAMVAIALFTAEDVPLLDIKRWRMNTETLALHYERLLTEAVQESGLEVFEESEEPGGGGRCGKKAKESVVYVLLSVSNDEKER